MKRVAALVLVAFLVLPMVAHAEEPFMFRDRYAWGMSAEEIKKLAAEEGLAYAAEYPLNLFYQNVPVAGIIAQELRFRLGTTKDGLDEIYYYITSDPQIALAWYPGLLEQLILLYGDYDPEASQQFMDEQQSSEAFVWKLPDTTIILIGQNKNNACLLVYHRETLPPSPTTPPSISFTGEGL